jgi:hypothetical protein
MFIEEINLFRINLLRSCIFAFALLSSSAYAETQIFKPNKTSPVRVPSEVDMVSTGPLISGELGLRVILLVYEIYYSIAVEEIFYGQTEGEPNEIKYSYFLNGFDVAPLLGRQRFTALKFVQWKTWNQFELEDNDLKFSVRYTPERTFEFKKLSGQ